MELPTELKEKLENDPQIESVTSRNRAVQLVYRHGQNHVSALIGQLSQAGVSYESIYSERPTLNDVFLQLTGKELRD